MHPLGVSLPVLILFFWTSVAAAQVTLVSSSIQTGASANTPACSDSGNGGLGVAMATASCSQPFGYTAASSASASVAADANGGTLTASAQAGATAPGDPPVNSSNGNAFANSFASWDVSATTFYSVSITGSSPSTVQGNGGVGLPPSGTLVAGDSLTVSLNPSAFALARDTAPLTAAESESGAIAVTFASVAASDLIAGNVLANGSPIAGLQVEALVAGTPVASAQTASDGRYLLPGLPSPVVLRFSDPSGSFVTELSPELTPPATYDADLAPAPAVPGLTVTGLLVLSIVCSVIGVAHVRRGSLVGS